MRVDQDAMRGRHYYLTGGPLILAKIFCAINFFHMEGANKFADHMIPIANRGELRIL